MMRLEEFYSVLRECGPDAFPFDTGDALGLPYAPFVEAYARHLSEDLASFNRYYSKQTTPAVRAGVLRLFAHYGLIKEGGSLDVVVGTGTLHVNDLICRELIERPGDAIAMPTPTYSIMIPQVEQAGGHPLLIPGRGKHSMEEIEAVIDGYEGRVVGLVHINPNLYGAAYGEEEVEELSELCADRGIVLIEDLAFFPLGAKQGRAPLASALGRRCRVVSMLGLSKPFGLANARLGIAVTDEELAERLVRRVETTIGFVPRSPQLALGEMLGGDLDLLDQFLEEKNRGYMAHRNVMLAGIRELSDWLEVVHEPEWGMFCMTDCSGMVERIEGVNDGFDAFEFLVRKCAVRSVPMELFGIDRPELRLSYSCDLEQLEGGLAAMKKALKGL